MPETHSQPVVKTDLSKHLPLLATGKVREIYSIDDNTLLFVATDRISAYDVVMANGIPNKGALLTLISEFWFRYLASQISHLRTHFVSLGLPDSLASRIPPAEVEAQQLQQRSCIVRKLNVLPVESIVRGYITGSAWESYKKTGMVNGEKLPEGLQESQKLDKPIWTPSTKAEQGAHDENISREQGGYYNIYSPKSTSLANIYQPHNTSAPTYPPRPSAPPLHRLSKLSPSRSTKPPPTTRQAEASFSRTPSSNLRSRPLPPPHQNLSSFSSMRY